MKRVLWLVALLALVLAGCGGAADEGASEGEGGGEYCVSSCTSSTLYLPAMPPCELT